MKRLWLQEEERAAMFRLGNLLIGMIQILAFLWALPLTLLGILKTLFVDGFWNFRGLAYNKHKKAWFCISKKIRGQPVNAVALTMGHWVVLSEALVDNVFQGPHIIPWPDALITGRHDRLLEHEARHVRQCEVFGPLMIILYPMASLWAWVRGKGFYEGNAFEVDARKHEGGATLLAMATKLIRNESKSVGRDH